MDRALAIATANHARHRAGQTRGHYESYFLRANHPSRPEAFWIRYTIFSPEGRPGDALGELWAVHFDGETRRHTAVREERPLSECHFEPERFRVAVGEARLWPDSLAGRASAAGHTVGWELAYGGESEPLFLLPLGLYEKGFPKAKALVGKPFAVFKGHLEVDARRVSVDGWVGSQNHNWGSKHTDHYAWGQVAGFDDAPESFLEVATGRLKIGPVWTPYLTPLVLRHRGVEHALNGMWRSVRTRAKFECFHWDFLADDGVVRVEGRIEAPQDAFVGLPYLNPPGGIKHCLNSKIASCRVTVEDRRAGTKDSLVTANRAAFEILTDARDHGVPVLGE